MNLAPLLRQTIAWQVGTQNDRGDRTYASATNVPGRLVVRSRDIIGPTGEVTTVAAVATMLEEPAIGDLLNGREVITVGPIVDIGGNTVGYQATTR